MPPSTIPSTSSAISSPGRRFGSSDQKRRRNGAARPTRHDDSPRRPNILTRRLNLTVPGQLLEPSPQPFQLATAYRPFLGNPVGALGEDIELAVLWQQLDFDSRPGGV